MRLNWNFVRLAMLTVVLLCVAGCSGINTSGSVSPASFFLPGLLKADCPQTNSPALLSEPSNNLAYNQ